MTANGQPCHAQQGLFSIFGSTFFELIGYFMLLPLLRLRLKESGVSTTVAGLFAACGWAGIFLVTPFSSWVTRGIGRRPALWLAARIPVVAALGFALTDDLASWFALALLAGAASGLRWVLAEAVVAEFAPTGQRHPIIMLAGFVGGFFESGITSILPLYGLALGLVAASAALLVAASGLGSALMMLPAGMLADRFSDPAAGRRRLMMVLAFATFAATCVVPLVAHIGWLAWPIVFLWGGAGGSLYTLAMIDIGSREQGITLVNSTAVLVLTYTLGSMVASAASGALLQWSPASGFPVLLATIALLGWLALLRTRHSGAF